MSPPGTISLRIDLDTANDEKICNLIPFVRLHRLELSGQRLANNGTIIKTNTITRNKIIRHSPSPPSLKRSRGRGQEAKSPVLPSTHLIDDTETSTRSKIIRQSPSLFPLKRTRRELKAKSPVLQSSHLLDDEETVLNNNPNRQSPSSPSPKRKGKMGLEAKSTVLQSATLIDDNIFAKKNNPSKQSPPHSVRRIVTRGQDSKGLDARPFKCTLCMECFHTSVLLAVHMRIHDKDSDEEDEDEEDVDDVEDFEQIDVDSDDTSVENESNRPGLLNSSLSRENENLPQNIRISSITSGRNSNSNSKTLSTTDEDSVSSVISNGGLPSPKSNSTAVELPQKRRGPIKLLKCKECPASFSQQWYLDLHLILLHYINNKNSSIKCPGCTSIFVNEHHLRQHIETSHSLHLTIMNNEISSALGLTTDALTGEHIKNQKKRGPVPLLNSLEQSHQVRRSFHTSIPNNLPSNWHMASSYERDQLIELLEAELKYIALERNRLGDHFSYSDIQRLSLQICEYLQVSNFFDNLPPKRWAQKVLIKVRQIPRPGRFRFVHNVNASYLNAVSELSNRGLSENKIFYAFEARICDVKKHGIAQRVPKTPIGATSPDVSVEDTICTVLCTNANGSVLLQPTIVFRNQIADVKSLHKLKALKTTYPSRDFLENDYFHEWFAQFLLAVPPARPILLLVEGCVSQLSFRIIMMARENDVHILFVPSRKRFVHSHQLIRESLLIPLMREFDKEVVKYLETHNLSSLNVKDFGKVFEPAWRGALPEAETRKSFIQSGFLPLPNSTAPLEVAARDYLDGVIAVGKGTKSSSDVSSRKLPKLTTHNKSTPDASPPAASVESTPSCVTGDSSTLTPEKIKEEPVDSDPSDEITQLPALGEIKHEPQESDPVDPPLDEFKQEVVDLPSSSQAVPQLEVVKFEAEEHECSGCNRSFHSLGDLSSHQCNVRPANPPRENTVGQSANEDCYYHKCSQCSMSYALKESLVLHSRTHHLPQAASSSGKKFPKARLVANPSNARIVKVQQQKDSAAPVLKRKTLIEEQTNLDNSMLKMHKKEASFAQVLKKKTTEEGGTYLQMPMHKVPHKVIWSLDGKPSPTSDSGTESASSTSSRTLSASPEPFNEHAYSSASRSLLPPPPLPEHDYLGQIYQNPARRNEIIQKRGIFNTLNYEDDTSSPVQKILIAMKAPKKGTILIHTDTLSNKKVHEWME